MTSVTSRSHGGLPKPQRITNPFDSDDEEPVGSSASRSQVSNSSSSAARSTGSYTNPFDDDASSDVRTKSKPVADRRVVQSSNPFDDEESPPQPSKHASNGNKIRAGHSSRSGSQDVSNPFDDDAEVSSKPKSRGERSLDGKKMRPGHASRSGSTNPFDDHTEVSSKPKSRGESILDDGSLFDDGEDVAAKSAKERKSSTRAFAAKIKESGSKMRESASNSLSNVKLPTFSAGGSSHHYVDEKPESKKGKAKQNSRDLIGEVEPGYHNSQQNYFAQSDESRFAGQSVEELEQYAVTKSQDTTSSIKNAIRIAEDTKGIATTTLEALHSQGEQIRRTHETAVRVDEELGRGEKLLGSLGGLFSMTWKPKKAHKITGPQVDPDQYKRKNHLGDRDALGLRGETTARPRQNLGGMSAAQAQLEMEKNTQDDALSDLSNVLGQLKGMTVEMGNEIERQNGDLDRMHDDVHELNFRVKGANNRTRHLLGR